MLSAARYRTQGFLSLGAVDLVPQLNSSLGGRYAIDGEIGRGGMATVYLARDMRHDRRVALKLLDPELGALVGVERFLAEIKVTANLQHPNLLPLFDSGEADGHLFYVMPFVEGESLRHRLNREKQLPVDEALRIATAIAGALDYAHRHGVIHRDLKPENILLHEGQPLVADFGIALAVSVAGGNRITQTGISLGTPQYMSPEQATGDRAIDGRTDIYSLGAMLYEMLVGDPPYIGSTSQAIISKVLTERPRPIRSARASVSGHVDRSVLRALEKLPADRFASAQEFADALAGRALPAPPEMTTAESATPSRRTTMVRRAVAGGALAVFGVFAAVGWMKALRHPPLPTTRFTLDIPDRQRFTLVGGVPVVLSPDGRAVLYAGTGGPASTQLYYQRLDELEAHALPGTEDAATPFFSSDGKTVGFAKVGTLYAVPVMGGTPRLVANVNTRSPSWTADGTIYSGTTRGLVRIRPGRNTTELLTEPDSAKGETAHGTPIAGPDGNTIIYWVRARPPRSDHLALLRLDTKESRDLEGDAVNALGVLDGYLIFGRQDGTLNAVRYDPRTLHSLTDAVTVLDGVAERTTGGVAASISRDGSLVYARGGATSQVVVTDDLGNTISVTPEPREYQAPRFSPDGRRLAAVVLQGGSADLWVFDLSTSILSRLTSDGSVSAAAPPSWTPDGTRVAYVNRQSKETDLWWAFADNSRPAEKVATLPQPMRAVTFAPDGRNAVLTTNASVAGNSSRTAVTELWRLPLDGDRKATPMVQSGFQERNAAVSPDGNWIAYASNATGRYQIYLRPFPGPRGGAIQISAAPTSADNPQWTRDGRLLFHVGDSLTAVTLSKGSVPAVVQQRTVFIAPASARATSSTSGTFTANSDGSRFAFIRPAGGAPQVVVVLNWVNDLRAKLAAAGR
jgi:serine/threonine-protein kinase